MIGCQSLPGREISRLSPLALAALLALGLSLPGAAQAQTSATAQQRIEFDVPAGPLTAALNRFSQRAGVALSFAPSLAEGKATAGVRGSHTTASGFAALLAGTGLQATMTSPGVYTLRSEARDVVTPPSAASASDYSLREVRVAARRLGETEGTGSYTSDAITVGKTAQAMREMPQSVAVLTRQRLDDQRITELSDAAAQATGITVQDSAHVDTTIYSRGFAIDSLQIDGGAPMTREFYSSGLGRNLSSYDRVEILRGVAGLLNGTGHPGGAVNLVRKMPTAQPQLNLTLSAGRWDNYRGELDVSGPLAFDGKLRGRAVLDYEDRKYFQDILATRSPSFYGVLEADLGPQTTLSVGTRQQRNNERGTSKYLPRYSNGADIGLPRNTSLTADWAYTKQDESEYFAKLTQRLGQRWTLRVNATRLEQEHDNKGIFGLGPVDPDTRLGVRRFGSRVKSENQQSMLDANLSGAFDMLGRTHELLVGADYQRVTSRWRSSENYFNGTLFDIFETGSNRWVDEPPATDDWKRDYTPNTQQQYGVYGTLRLEVADATKLILGARANRYKYEQQYFERWDADGNAIDYWRLADATQYKEPTKIVPFAGVVHDLNHEWTAYASYAEIFKPQSSSKAGPAPGVGLKPMSGNNTEVGVKGELLGGKLQTAFALYRMVQKDRAVLDTRYPAYSELWAGSCCYLASGKVVSQGIDMEVSGEIARGVNVYAGYTYNHNRDKTENAVFSTITPKHLLKLWGTWQLPGDASAWKLGGGATINSRQYVTGTAASFNPATGKYDGANVPFNYTQSGYAVLNLMAEYRFDPNWTLSLNVGNVLDRVYYRTVGSSVLGNYYGEPRNAVVTLRGRF